MSKNIKTIIILLILFVIAIAGIKLLFFPENRPFSGVVSSLSDSITGNITSAEEDVYVREYSTTTIIARDTSPYIVRFIQNVGDQPVTLWLFADATTTQPTYTGGFIRLTSVFNSTSTDSIIDLSWFRGSVYAVTESDPTYLKVSTYP